MLTARDEGDDKVRILREGASDYIIKPFKVEELRARVSAVIKRSEALRGNMRQKMESMIAAAFSETAITGQPTTRRIPEGISHRETEVMDLVLRGMSDKEIADELGISVRTASNHVAAILRKTGRAGRNELMEKFEKA